MKILLRAALLGSLFLLPALAGFFVPVGFGVALWIVAGIMLGPVSDLVHDSIHLTFTGKKWFDRGVPMRLAYAAMGLPFRSTLISHMEHHRFSGRDHSKDPELNLGNPYLMVLSGMFGIQKRLWREAFKRSTPLQLAVEVAIVGAVQIALLAGMFWVGWQAFVFRLVALQIVGGGLIQIRFLLPHYGLHAGGGSDSACRYIATECRYWDSATLHGIHHQDTSIPTHELVQWAPRLTRDRQYVSMGEALRRVFQARP